MASNLEAGASTMPPNPLAALLDTFFPGFSLITTAIQRYLKIDVTLYIPAILAIGLLVWSSQYATDYLWEKMEIHFMSTADIRVDDECYNFFFHWMATQKFAKNSRRFVPQTNVNSRNWALWWSSRDNEEDSDDEDSESNDTFHAIDKQKNKPLQYTPSFGTHYFWYKGRILLFKRAQAQQQQAYGPISDREEISISSFGRDPALLKELLDECRTEFLKNDENRTLIYRGATKPGTTEPVWTRCMSRVSRPFSTVVLDETVKQSLLEDMQDYLHPLTRRWYSNRGIPYRRGYLLYGPPGTGKSSLSFAVAGYFKLKIYIVSLNSLAMNEENLGTLFADLPKRCVVLLEDIDTAGLTHTRDDAAKAAEEEAKDTAASTTASGATTTAATSVAATTGRISLSALLNVIDGVASQEGRVLVMTTNHIEKLDEALIRPGRVDMKIKFDLSDSMMVKTLFKGIFTTMEGDVPKSIPAKETALATFGKSSKKKQEGALSAAEKEKLKNEEATKKVAEEIRISALADDFAALIPTYTFSPAEIQGFLLKHKRNAAAAVVGAEQWVKDTLAQKEKSKKLEQEKKEKEKKEAHEKKEKEEKETKEEKEKDEKEVKEAMLKEKREKTEKEAKEVASVTEDNERKDSMLNGTEKTMMVNGIGNGVHTNGVGKETMTNGIEKDTLTNGIEA